MSKKHEIKVRLTDTEFSNLKAKVNQCGYSREEYIRRVLKGTTVMERPPADVPKLVMEVRRVGININEILKRANMSGLLDVPMLRRALEENRAVEKMIVDAYTKGRSYER